MLQCCNYCYVDKGVEKMSIGENIKRLRESRNLTQNQLGEMINVTQPMIAQLERGTRTLTIPLGMDIAKALDCKFDELITDLGGK